MKTKIFLLASFVFSLVACKEEASTVIVAGDSWATFVCTYKSLDTSLKSAVTNSACLTTTRTGMRAENWLKSPQHKATALALTDKKIKVLFLSLGGNDFLNYWNRNLSTAQEEVVFETIRASLQEIIDTYQIQRPDVKILISGYDFPRFTENHPIEEYKTAFEQMGSPTASEINNAMIRYANTMIQLKGVAYLHHMGLMHYYFGNSDFGLTPLSTLAPNEIGNPASPEKYGGEISLPSDKAAMLKVGNWYDAFHLSKEGYAKLSDHAAELYLRRWLQL